MQIFVINLEKDVERRESISVQLEALGLNYEFVSGVNGAALLDHELARVYDDRKALLHRSRSLVPSEIGCALSHLSVYRAIIDRRLDAALILEDDVTLPNNLRQILGECFSNLKAAAPSVWLLSPAQGDIGVPATMTVGASHRLLPYRSGYFASSYLITHAAAMALLRELEPVSDVADCWQRLASYKVVDLYVVVPALIEQLQNQFGSSTTSDIIKFTEPGVMARALYKARRVRSIFWGFFYGLYRRRFRPYAGLKFESKE